MFRNVLVPLDGSELAERVLPLVAHVAPPSALTLHLVRVVDLVPRTAFSSYMPYVDQNMMNAEMEECAAYLERMRGQLTAQGFQVQTKEFEGEPASTLLDYEGVAQIDLVAMCSHGRTGLARFALGSVAERLIRYGMAPVLLARAFGPVAVPARTVIPLDGSARSQKVLEILPSVSRDVSSQVTLLRVVPHAEDRPAAVTYLEQVVTRPELAGLQVTTEVEDGDIASVIAAVSGNDSLVLMTTHGRTGLARWALGSVADRITHGSTSAVLLLRQP
jgi:nucleotide-binding universal stress UspA family protein